VTSVKQKRAPKPSHDEQGPSCLACESRNVHVIRKGIREDPERPIYRCMSCRLQFIGASFTDLHTFYREQYRDGYDVARGKKLTPEERFMMMRPFMLEPAMRFREHVPEGASVLEIGCSSGYFLDTISKDYDVFGNEWNPDDAAYVRDVGGIECEEGDILDVFPGKKFTAIVGLQVMEHQPDPLGWLRKVKSRLIGGGYLYLELPNANDALVTVYGLEEYRQSWYREPHITYWEKETLAAVMASLGFESKISTRQRYGLVNHVNWILNQQPQSNAAEAMRFFMPVSEQHPASALLNRCLGRIDKEYRSQLETIGAADCLSVRARRREI
jgi:SAM-dependent methyltransferase